MQLTNPLLSWPGRHHKKCLVQPQVIRLTPLYTVYLHYPSWVLRGKNGITPALSQVCIGFWRFGYHQSSILSVATRGLVDRRDCRLLTPETGLDSCLYNSCFLGKMMTKTYETQTQITLLGIQSLRWFYTVYFILQVLVPGRNVTAVFCLSSGMMKSYPR